jgi:hypothetical protein
MLSDGDGLVRLDSIEHEHGYTTIPGQRFRFSYSDTSTKIAYADGLIVLERVAAP